MKTKPKKHLLANGDYSTAANCRKEILATFRGIIVIFSVLKKQLRLYAYSVISRGPRNDVQWNCGVTQNHV